MLTNARICNASRLAFMLMVAMVLAGLISAALVEPVHAQTIPGHDPGLIVLCKWDLGGGRFSTVGVPLSNTQLFFLPGFGGPLDCDAIGGPTAARFCCANNSCSTVGNVITCTGCSEGPTCAGGQLQNCPDTVRWNLSSTGVLTCPGS